MEELATGGFIEKFGLDARLLLAQVVNFAIVLFVLSRFVFRPLLRTMRTRTERIEGGLKSAEEAEQKKQAVQEWERTERRRVHDEASALLLRAEGEARARREVLLREAETEAQTMHDHAAADAARLQEDALRKAREDVGVLALDVAERVLGKHLTPAERNTYLEDAMETVEQQTRGTA